MKTLMIGLLSVFFGVAQAQSTNTSFDFELFRPSSDHYGYFAVPSAATLGHLQLGGGFWVNYQNDPVVFVSDNARARPELREVTGDNGEGIVDDRLTGNIHLGLGISKYFSFSIDAPIILWQDGYKPDGGVLSQVNPPTALSASGLGDIRVMPKGVILDRSTMPIGLAIAMPVGIPTGSSSEFTGEGGVSLTPSAIFEFSDGPIRSRKYAFRSAIQTGYQVRPGAQVRDVAVDNAFVYGVAMGLHASVMEIVAEFHGTIFGDRAAQQPAEVLGGHKILAAEYVSINVGGGMDHRHKDLSVLGTHIYTKCHVLATTREQHLRLWD